MKKILSIILLFISINTYSQYSQGLVNIGIPADKQQHFIAGGLIAPWGYVLTLDNTGSRRKAKIWGIAVPTVAGILKEWSDIKTTGFDLKDLGATILGAVVVTYTIDFLHGRKLHREKVLLEREEPLNALIELKEIEASLKQ